MNNFKPNPMFRNYCGAFAQEAQKSKLKSMDQNGDSKIAFAGIYNIIFANDYLSCELTDLLCELQKSKYYRHEAKQVCKKIKAEMNTYESEMNKVIGEKSDYFADSADKMSDIMKKHRDVLYWSIKQVLDDHNIKDSGLLANVVLFDVLASYCAATVDFYIDHISKKIGFDCGHLKYLRLTSIQKQASRLVELLIKLKYDVRLEDNERCKTAFEIFASKMGDIDNLKKATDYDD